MILITYTKFHSSWAGADQLTGEAWNHIETQWDYIKSDADLHSHNDRYYPKATADTTFFSTSYFTGFDADKLDNYHVSDVVATVFPVGSILMWNSDSSPPTGWAICNGGSGTPDLRDYFVSGCDTDGNLGLGSPTYGPATWNGTLTPTGSVSVGTHAITEAELPAHTHTYSEYYSPVGNQIYYGGSVAYLSANTARSSAVGNQASGGDAHGHSGSTISFGAVDPRPLYYATYYIMKVS